MYTVWTESPAIFSHSFLKPVVNIKKLIPDKSFSFYPLITYLYVYTCMHTPPLSRTHTCTHLHP